MSTLITLREIDWEDVVDKVKRVPYKVKQKRKLQISNIPSSVFSYVDSHMYEHTILCSVLNITTGEPLSKKSLCWYCRQTCEDFSIGIPIKKKDDVYYVEGCYCNWSQMKASVKEKRFDPHYEFAERLCVEMYLKMTGLNWVDLKEANDWKLLEIFGGPMSLEEWEIPSAIVPIKGIHLSPVARLWEKKSVR